MLKVDKTSILSVENKNLVKEGDVMDRYTYMNKDSNYYLKECTIIEEDIEYTWVEFEDGHEEYAYNYHLSKVK